MQMASTFAKTGAALAAVMMMAASPALAQVGGGSIGGSGTVGGGGAVGGTTLNSGGGTSISPGNQNPGPGSPVLPNNPATSTGSASSSTFRVPGNTGAAETQGGLSTGTQGIDRAPTAATTPPQSIIDQPTPPSIPAPDSPAGDPATINLQQDLNPPAQ
jgi:hypothetical protein